MSLNHANNAAVLSRVAPGGLPTAYESGVSTTLIRLPRVLSKTCLSKSSVYALIASNQFPKPVRLGPNTVAWLEWEVDGWIAERVAASRKAASGRWQ